MKLVFTIFILLFLFSFNPCWSQNGIYLEISNDQVTNDNGITGIDNSGRYVTFFGRKMTKKYGIPTVTSFSSSIFDTYIGKFVEITNESQLLCIGKSFFEIGSEIWTLDPPDFRRNSKFNDYTLGELQKVYPLMASISSVKDNYFTIHSSIKKNTNETFGETYVQVFSKNIINNSINKLFEKPADISCIDLFNNQLVVVKRDPGSYDSFLDFYDLNSGELNKRYTLTEDMLTLGSAFSIDVNGNGDVFIGVGMLKELSGISKEKVLVIPKNNFDMHFEIPGGLFISLDVNSNKLLTVSPNTGIIELRDLDSGNVIYKTKALSNSHTSAKGGGINKFNNGKHFLIAYTNNISSLIDTGTKQEICKLYIDEKDWAVIAADGRVDGSKGAFEKLEWREYVEDQLISKTSLESSFNNFYTPGLFQLLINGNIENNQSLQEFINQAPAVEITSPNNETTSSDKQASITVKATSNGDPISDIQLFVNNKLIGVDTRGFKSVGLNEKTFEVVLVKGENVIAAKAISQKYYESPLDKITITYTGPKSNANLHILAVGLDQYMNSAYNLNYAIADASAFSSKLNTSSTDIFNNTYVYEIFDQNAQKKKLIQQFEMIATQSKPEDVFVFFYAGHGVMSEGVSKDFYLALHGVTQLYGRDDLLQTNGLSATELRDYSAAIKAQKQVIILDACQSGGAVTTFASRGAAEEKAVVQLARSSGAILLSSTGSEQLAAEFDQLGHGVFTYALLQAMDGKADGGSLDGKITVKEIEAYLNDQIPVLTEKYKGTPQYPRAWSTGQDFPIVIKGTK
ncbi:MAG: caspase family protein [Reichenbachiella sp.]